MTATTGPRRIAREFALRTLYGFDILQQIGEQLPLYPTRDWWGADDSLKIPKQAEQYAREFVLSVKKNSSEIDEYIKKHSRNWRLERLSPVDRNILRLAIYELLYDKETPASVILNEAIELAKCYGDSNSSRFLNGILDSVTGEVRSAN